MRKFLFSFFIFLLLNTALTISKAGDGASSIKQPVDGMLLGRFGEGFLRYEAIRTSRLVIEHPIKSIEYDEMCSRGVCEAAWSSGEGHTWVALRNILSNQVMVLSQNAQVQWRGLIHFEPRSMLSVSKDGKTIAAIGRLNGIDSVWHITKDGTRLAWRLPTVFNCERFQVGWQEATGGNLVFDGEWALLCEGTTSDGCQRLYKGYLPSLSPDGNMVALLRNDKTLEVYDITNRTLMASFETKVGWGHDAAKWSPDSKFLILNEATRRGSRLAIVELSRKKTLFTRRTDDKSIAHVGVARILPPATRIAK